MPLLLSPSFFYDPRLRGDHVAPACQQRHQGKLVLEVVEDNEPQLAHGFGTAHFLKLCIALNSYKKILTPYTQ